jgi:hypothetical protein
MDPMSVGGDIDWLAGINILAVYKLVMQALTTIIEFT